MPLLCCSCRCYATAIPHPTKPLLFCVMYRHAICYANLTFPSYAITVQCHPLPCRCAARLHSAIHCPCFATLDGLNHAHAAQSSAFLSYAIATPAVHYFAGAEQCSSCLCHDSASHGLVMPSPHITQPFSASLCRCDT